MKKLFSRFYNGILTIIIRSLGKSEDRMMIKIVRKNYKKLKNRELLTDGQISEIQSFYEGLVGHKVPTEWHQYFYSRTGVFSKRYVPSSEYKHHLIGRLNVYPLHLAYNDKNITDITLAHTHQPKIFLKNMGGYFYSDGEPISREDALQRCKDLGEVIIKPSLSGRGKGVKKIHIQDGMTDYNGLSLTALFDEYFADYLIQAVVQQHPDLKRLNPSSINTIRVVSYRNGMEVYIVYTVIRIGREGMSIDNESAGGISVRIKADGTLDRYAYGAPGVDKVEFTDSGVRLEGFKVPCFDEAMAFVKRSHLQLPYFNFIGWDIAIEEDGTPVMIELNLNPDLSQSANGPAFGEYTEMIIKDAMSRNDTWHPMATSIMTKRNYKKK